MVFWVLLQFCILTEMHNISRSIVNGHQWIIQYVSIYGKFLFHIERSIGNIHCIFVYLYIMKAVSRKWKKTWGLELWWSLAPQVSQEISVPHDLSANLLPPGIGALTVLSQESFWKPDEVSVCELVLERNNKNWWKSTELRTFLVKRFLWTFMIWFCVRLLIFASLRVKQIDFSLDNFETINHQPRCFFLEPQLFHHPHPPTVIPWNVSWTSFCRTPWRQDFYDSMRAGKVFQPSDLKQIEAITPGLVWFSILGFHPNAIKKKHDFGVTPNTEIRQSYEYVWMYMNMLKEDTGEENTECGKCGNNIRDKKDMNIFEVKTENNLKHFQQHITVVLFWESVNETGFTLNELADSLSLGTTCFFFLEILLWKSWFEVLRDKTLANQFDDFDMEKLLYGKYIGFCASTEWWLGLKYTFRICFSLYRGTCVEDRQKSCQSLDPKVLKTWPLLPVEITVAQCLVECKTFDGGISQVQIFFMIAFEFYFGALFGFHYELEVKASYRLIQF